MWQSSPNFLAPGTGFFEASFFRNGGGHGFGMIQCIALHFNYLLCTLFLSLSHQLHLSSSGIRARGLRTLALKKLRWDPNTWHPDKRCLLAPNLEIGASKVVTLAVKTPACQSRRRKRWGFSPWVRKIPWRRNWQPTPVFLPGESHGQRSLVAFSPGDHRS